MQEKLWIGLVLCICCRVVYSQDALFSQPGANKLYLNPAFAGINEVASVFVGYRNQWPDLNASFVSYCMSYEQPVDYLHGTLAFLLVNDMQAKGIIKNFSLAAMYAYKMHVRRYTRLRAGLQATYGQHSLSSSMLRFADMFDPSTRQLSNTSQEVIQSQNHNFIDFSGGLMLDFFHPSANALYYVGVAVNHLTQPKNPSGIVLNRKYTVHAGTNFPLQYSRLGKEKIRMNPVIIYQKQSMFEFFQYGSSFLTEQYAFGAALRHNVTFHLATIVLHFGIKTSSYSFTYSYDFLPSKKSMEISKLGAHEVTFLFDFEYKGKLKHVKYPKI